MSQVKDKKSWKKYHEGKNLVGSRPEASWLGNEEGMRQDQAIRIRNAICKSQGLDIDLRKLMKNQFLQKFTHENNFVPYVDKTYDVITKLAVHGTDEKPRKDESQEKKDDDIRGGEIT